MENNLHASMGTPVNGKKAPAKKPARPATKKAAPKAAKAPAKKAASKAPSKPKAAAKAPAATPAKAKAPARPAAPAKAASKGKPQAPKAPAKPKAPVKKVAALEYERKYTIDKDRPTQHGKTRPSANTTGGKMWAALEALEAKQKSMPTLEDAKAIAEKLKVNATSATISYYRWRKFNGVRGRQ